MICGRVGVWNEDRRSARRGKLPDRPSRPRDREIGHRERFPIIVDLQVAAQEWGWAGGGREELLVKVRSADIIRLNGARVADVIRDSV